MGLVVIMMGLSAWFAPHYRMFAGIVTGMCAAAALVLSDLGGFLLGNILGVIGGSMVFAWQPHASPPAEPDAGPPAEQTDQPSTAAEEPPREVPPAPLPPKESP